MMSWKSPPRDSSKLWLNPSLECQILLACSWNCQSCDQLSNYHGISFIKKGTMTMSQFHFFVEEMKSNNAYFGRIRIVGGEPTGHSKFQEIIRLLHSELVPDYIGHLEVVTNGDGMDKIEPVKHLFAKVRVSGERAKRKNHVANMRATPKSLGYEGKRCGQPEFCGWSLNYWGYAPCSTGAGLMRLHNMMDMHQISNLPRVPGTNANWPGLQSLCNLCLHALRDEDKVMAGTGQLPGDHGRNVPNQESWESLAPWLMGKQPEWKAYGAPTTAEQ